MSRRPIESSSQEAGPVPVASVSPDDGGPTPTGGTAPSNASDGTWGAESDRGSTSLSGIPRSSWYRAAAAAMMAPDAEWAATETRPVRRRPAVVVDELRRLYLDEGLPA